MASNLCSMLLCYKSKRDEYNDLEIFSIILKNLPSGWIPGVSAKRQSVKRHCQKGKVVKRQSIKKALA